MLIQHLKTKRDIPVASSTVFYPTTYHQNKQLDHKTYIFRDKTIKDLVRDAGYSYGDVVRPSTQEAYDKEGCYRVVGIMGSWFEYKGQKKSDFDVKWPESNNPMIVLAMNMKSGTNIEATTNYFIKATELEVKNAEDTSGC